MFIHLPGDHMLISGRSALVGTFSFAARSLRREADFSDGGVGRWKAVEVHVLHDGQIIMMTCIH